MVCSLINNIMYIKETLDQDCLFAYSGNTGYSLSPRLVLSFFNEELGVDIRVIYLIYR